MAVYFVTGKLGSGKTLAAVGRIKEYLHKGAPVATNLDLNLSKLIGDNKKNTRVYRFPDKPTVDDLNALGKGNFSYDESQNGLLVFDECGTWFNSRSWNDKSRQALIDWFLHARKLGWDIIFIIQNVQIVDKQARLALCEYMVVCRRADRFLKIPLIEPLFKLLFSAKVPKPQFHLGIVKYGDTADSLTVDRWWYRGSDLYDAYDTKQVFTDNYHHSLYQLLPPYYSVGRYRVPRDLEFYMRMTKIYWKRFSKPLMLSLGVMLGVLLTTLYAFNHFNQKLEEFVNSNNHFPIELVSLEQDVQPEVNQGNVDSQIPIDGNSQGSQSSDEPFIHPMKGFNITGQASANGELLFMTVGNGTEQYSLQELKAIGYQVRVIDDCRLRVLSEGVPYVVHAQSCAASQIASEATVRAYIANAPKFADPNRDYSRSE